MSTDSIVPVSLGARSYRIHVGPGLIERAGALIAPLGGARRLQVITDTTVAELHLDRFARGLAAAGLEHEAIILTPGEQTKDWASLGRLLDTLLSRRPDRGTLLVALGGGVIGDLTGVAASLLLRGVDFVQIPTTLLAQVDSSVGGKTGVNARQGKNLIGAFHQPRLVLADIDALATLPRREFLAGYAEVAKYGLLGDAEFFSWLEAHGDALVEGDAALRQTAVERSCVAKARIVAADERETGDRALLNLGHTFGHAMETATGYGGALLHGEAVAIGMVLAFDLSAALGLCPPADALRARRHLAAMGLPTDPPRRGGRPIPAEELVGLMGQDKKARDGRLTFVLARGIGRAFVTREVEPEAVTSLLRRAQAA